MKLITPNNQPPQLSQALIDLDILKLLMIAEPDFTEKSASAWALTYFSSNPDELRARYAVFQDLQGTEAITQAYESLLTLQDEMDKMTRAVGHLYEVLYSYRALKSYKEAIAALTQLILHNPGSSRLKDLRKLLGEIENDPEYSNLMKLESELASSVPFPQYIYVGINAREDGEPIDIAILRDSKETEDLQPLIDEKAPTAASKSLFPDLRYTREQYGSHFEEYLTTHLEKHYHGEIQKLYKRIQNLKLPQTEDLLDLTESLRYYKIGMQMHALFTSRGYALCCPDPSGSDMKASKLMYPDLALNIDDLSGKTIDILAGSSTLITGANHSGKTSYLKTVGQALMMAQLGFFIPAESYSYQPYHNVYTLFSAGEDSSMSVSRMGVEIQKLTSILNESSSSDLVLINEPMTSTNPVEAVSICAELMDHFLKKNITHLVVTHLYDIYYILLSRLSDEDKKRMTSLVTQSHYDASEGMIHSYKLMVSPPLGNSYAMETAKQFGITLEDLLSDAALVAEASAFCETEDAASIYQGGEQ